MVKPNHLVRMVVPTGVSQLICQGRIVWVVYEQPLTSVSAYRMGVKFTEVDASAVEDFMKDFCEEWRVPSQPLVGNRITGPLQICNRRNSLRPRPHRHVFCLDTVKPQRKS